jgi:hypothetical protein
MMQLEHFDTATLNIGRFTPQTPKQRASVLAGIGTCDSEWKTKRFTTHDQRLAAGWDRYQRAAYNVRYHEQLAAWYAQMREDAADIARWEGEGGASL